MLCFSKLHLGKLEKPKIVQKFVYFGKLLQVIGHCSNRKKHRTRALFAYMHIHVLKPHVFDGSYEKTNHGKGTIGNAVRLKIPSTQLKNRKYLGKVFSSKEAGFTTNFRTN